MNDPRKTSFGFRFLLLCGLVTGVIVGGVVLGQAHPASASFLAGSPAESQAALAWDGASFSVGSTHSCAVTPSGGVKCWGNNDFGQLGDGTTTARSTPVDVVGLTGGVVAVAAGSDFSCALTTGGEVKCWGSNWGGQLGVSVAGETCGSDDCSKTPVLVSGLSGVAAITTGSWHACALVNGGVKCWGYNDDGQLGDGSTTWRSAPVDVINPLTSNPLGGIISVAAGEYHTCAVTESGAVKCWGANYDGQLGDGTTDGQLFPVDVSGLVSSVDSVAAGGNHSCALVGGNVKCWGANLYGQLGDGTVDDHLTPDFVTDAFEGDPLSGVTMITAGGYHTCALMGGGEVKCWGENYVGQLGDGSVVDYRPSPVAVLNLTGAAAIDASDANTCARFPNADLKCWGDNDMGQMGIGRMSYRATPVDVVGLNSGVTTFAAGSSFACAVSGSGVNCWGQNYKGQLGDGTSSDRSSPVAVITDVPGGTLLSGVASVAAGDDHTCGLMSGGGIKCWGNNWRGQLGDGNADNESYIPVDVLSLGGNASAVTAGDMFTCAIVDGGVKCWGSNVFGQLGGNLTSYEAHSPTAVIDKLTSTPISGIVSLTAGDYHACALTSGGAVKCWGMNQYGQLGVSTATTACPIGGEPCSTVAVDVTGLASGVAAIAAGGSHTCAVMASNGSVKCWGDNDSRQLGTSTTTTCSIYGSPSPCSETPLSVSGVSGVTAIAGGGYFTCALTSDGGVQCWGANYRGQLGDGTDEVRLSPVDVLASPGGAALNGVTAITAGSSHACALNMNGGVQCWGDGYDGQLGAGEFGYFPTPVKVVGLNYWKSYLSVIRR